MIIDKDQFCRLVINIKDLKNNKLLADREELQREIDCLDTSYAEIAGIIAIEDNITDCVSSTDLLYRIGIIKESLTKIRDDECQIITPQNIELVNAIRFVLSVNPCDDEYSEQQICSCGGIMLYEKKYLQCSQCDSIKYNNIDNFNIDIPNTSENISRNNNIVKHLNKNLSYISGENLPEKLPKDVVDIICGEINF
jgi:hypothetical protein